MYVKDLVIEDGVVIDNAYRVYFTLVTQDGEHRMMEWVDKNYRLYRDNSSDMLKPGYTQIKSLLKDTKMYIHRLMDGLDAGIALQKKFGKELTPQRWYSLFLNSRKR